MKVRTLLRKIAIGGMLAASFIMAMPTSVFACTQIYIGKDLTTTGETFVGRSEDVGERYAKVFGVQERVENPTFRSFENDAEPNTGFEWTYEGTGYRYTYVRDSPYAWDAQDDDYAWKVYSEAGVNEKGVSVSATLSTRYNDNVKAADPTVPTGIGEYNVTDVLLSISSSAREGVKLLGEIIDEKGSQACNHIIIADAKETWIFMQLSGHEWFALNMPDDQVSVNPNLGNMIFEVSLDDLENEDVCLHSDSVVSMPQENGFLKFFEDGVTPDIATTYGRAGGGSRYAIGRDYFGAPLENGTDYTIGADGTYSQSVTPEFLFTPDRQISLFDALRSLAARGEGTENLNANLNGKLTAIGTPRTAESHFFQIRHNLVDQPDIATIQWQAMSRTEFSVYLPIYSALLTEVPAEYYPAWEDLSLDHEREGTGERDSVTAALSEEPGKVLDYVFMDINTLAYNNRDALAGNVRAYLDVLQNELIKQQELVDTLMKATPAENRSDLANRAFKAATEQTYTKAKALLNEMRAHVKSGSTDEFVPSDYDVASDTMKTPVLYASSVVAPTFVEQPQSATYTQGDAAAPLTAKATLQDGVEGSDATLAYQWYTVDTTGTAQAISGATGSSFTPATDAVGKTSYRVAVTSPAGIDAWSDIATVTVEEKKTDPDVKPNPDTKPNPSDKPSKDKPTGTLAQTGDDSVIWIAGFTVVALALIGGGIVLVRKRS